MSRKGVFDLYTRLCDAFGKEASKAQAQVYGDHLGEYGDEVLAASENRILGKHNRFPSIAELHAILKVRQRGVGRYNLDPKVVAFAQSCVDEGGDVPWCVKCLASGRACSGSDCDTCEHGEVV